MFLFHRLMTYYFTHWPEILSRFIILNKTENFEAPHDEFLNLLVTFALVRLKPHHY